MQTSERRIEVTIAWQQLELRDGGTLLRRYPVSTSAYGVGSEPGSLKTPVGKFRIAEKIGYGAPPGMIFRSRLPTGEIGSAENPEDLVLTRILWLDGLEDENRNTYERYIYIHGTNQESAIGTPASHGCIRMRNMDVIDLFDMVETETEVTIHP